MKKLTIITATMFALLFFTACESEKEKAAKVRETCYVYLHDPAMKEYYTEAYLQGFENLIEDCKDNVSLLEDTREQLLDKLAEAKAEISIRELTE